MLTCPHCRHSFEGTSASSSSAATSTVSSTSAAPACCCAAPVASCVRVFAGSGGGIIVSEGKPTCSSPHLQVSFQQPPPGLQVSFSPSVQIVLPSWPSPAPTAAASIWSSANLTSTHKALVTSGWYYEALNGEDSLIALKNCPPGTFLVRDSSDPEHLFSLSVQTTRGPTSVRLHYLNGEFRLDAQNHLAHHVPRFACVLRLIEHYVREGRLTERRRSASDRTYVNVSPPPEPGSHVWVDDRGRTHSPILLTRPLRRRVSTLQHMARLAINQRLQHRDRAALDLPAAIEDYLREYPYTQ